MFVVTWSTIGSVHFGGERQRENGAARVVLSLSPAVRRLLWTTCGDVGDLKLAVYLFDVDQSRPSRFPVSDL